MRKNILIYLVAVLLLGASASHTLSAHAQTAAEICREFEDQPGPSLHSPYPEFWEMRREEALWTHELDEFGIFTDADGTLFDYHSNNVRVLCHTYPYFKEHTWLNKIVAQWGYGVDPTGIVQAEAPLQQDILDEKRDSIEVVYPVHANPAYDNTSCISFIYTGWDPLARPVHERYRHWAATYNLTTREQVQLQDIFIDWNCASPRLAALVREIYDNDMGGQMLQEVNTNFSGNFSSFALAPDMLLLISDGYPIHLWNYAAVAIPREELAHLLKPGF